MLSAFKAIPWTGLCLVAIATMLFFSGWHAKGVQVKATTTKLTNDLGTAKAVIEQQQEQIIWERKYELQLRTAASEASARLAELARIRSVARTRVMCVAADSSSSPVSSIPAALPPGLASPGSVPQAAGQDITNDLYILADDADDAVEQAREFIAKVPQ